MKYQVLLIEDEVSLASSIRSLLEDEGIALIYVSDGKSGYDLALKQQFDLIILDVQLPRMNGFEILTELRRSEIQTPILMLTTRNEVPDIVSGLNSGADDYLGKPFNSNELLARVKKLIKRPPSKRQEVLKFSDLIIDLAKLEVTKSGAIINFSKAEYNLLVYLVSHKGRILTREKLLADIWFGKDINQTNTVDKTISNIRSKLKQHGSKAVIKTVHGFGYQIRD